MGTGKYLKCTQRSDRSISGLLSWRVCARTVDLAVVGAGANKTVRLSKAREGNGPQFKVNLIPAYS